MTDSLLDQENCPVNVDAAARPIWSATRSHVTFWLLALLVCGLDLGSKYAIFKQSHEVTVLIPGCLRFARTVNDGAAFSLASGRRDLLVAVSVIALVLVVGMHHFGRHRSNPMTVWLGLFAGGIAGNLYDRAFNQGQVRDFIDAYIGNHHWPTFNVADSALCIAVGLMILSTLRDKK